MAKSTYVADHNGRTTGAKTKAVIVFKKDQPFEAETGDVDHLGKSVEKITKKEAKEIEKE